MAFARTRQLGGPNLGDNLAPGVRKSSLFAALPRRRRVDARRCRGAAPSMRSRCPFDGHELLGRLQAKPPTSCGHWGRNGPSLRPRGSASPPPCEFSQNPAAARWGRRRRTVGLGTRALQRRRRASLDPLWRAKLDAPYQRRAASAATAAESTSAAPQNGPSALDSRRPARQNPPGGPFCTRGETRVLPGW